MAILLEGGNKIVDATVDGSIFPDNEKDIKYPVLIDATRGASPISVAGAVFGYSLVVRGAVTIQGPIVSRGDMRIEPKGQWVRLLSGMTVNGSVNAKGVPIESEGRGPNGLSSMSILVKGDIAANQSIFLSNAIVFGSIRATNCTLEDCVVLGTVVATERLVITRSTIAGYLAGSVSFQGGCTLIHAIGESASRPMFLPSESADGTIDQSDVRFYPSLRHAASLINHCARHKQQYPEHSKLDADSDWVEVEAAPNEAIDGDDASRLRKWVLSLGGRIGDMRKLQASVEAMAEMLKCGFEFEHYPPAVREREVKRVGGRLTNEEAWILTQVCTPVGVE